MHQCGGVHESLSILTNLIHANSEQHVELGRSQKKLGNTDLQKLLLQFNCHEPFDFAEFHLKSLSTVLVASDNINCNNAETVEEALQNVLDNICIQNIAIPGKAQVCTLQLLKPLILSTDLPTLIQRDEKGEENFKFKLTPEPTTLFRNGMMQKSETSVIRNHLLNKYQSCDCLPDLL